MGGPDRDRVSADPHEAGMAETHLPGETHQQVQSDGSERKYEHQGRDAIVISGRKKHWQHDHHGGHGQRWHKSMSQEPLHEALDAMSIPLSRMRSEQGQTEPVPACVTRHEVGHKGHTRSIGARPNSPRGVANRTIKMIRNATASLYCEET